MDAAHIAFKDAASGVRATARRRLPVQERILHAHPARGPARVLLFYPRAYPGHHSACAETLGSKALRSDEREPQIWSDLFLKQNPQMRWRSTRFEFEYEKRSAPQANEGDSRKSQPNFSIRRKCRYERFDAEPGHNELELSLDREALLSICIHRTLHRKEKIILELLKIIKREFKKVRAGVSPCTQEFHEWPLSCPLKKSHTIKFDARP